MKDDDIPPGWYLSDGEPRATWFWIVEHLIACDRPIRILGRMCDSAGCLNLAQFRTYWPAPTSDRYELGQVKCALCATKLDDAARAMGFGLPVQPIHIERNVEIMMLADYRAAIAREAEQLRRRELGMDDSERRFAAMEFD